MSSGGGSSSSNSGYSRVNCAIVVWIVIQYILPSTFVYERLFPIYMNKAPFNLIYYVPHDWLKGLKLCKTIEKYRRQLPLCSSFPSDSSSLSSSSLSWSIPWNSSSTTEIDYLVRDHDDNDGSGAAPADDDDDDQNNSVLYPLMALGPTIDQPITIAPSSIRNTVLVCHSCIVLPVLASTISSCSSTITFTLLKSLLLPTDSGAKFNTTTTTTTHNMMNGNIVSCHKKSNSSGTFNWSSILSPIMYKVKLRLVASIIFTILVHWCNVSHVIQLSDGTRIMQVQTLIALMFAMLPIYRYVMATMTVHNRVSMGKNRKIDDHDGDATIFPHHPYIFASNDDVEIVENERIIHSTAVHGGDAGVVSNKCEEAGSASCCTQANK